ECVGERERLAAERAPAERHPHRRRPESWAPFHEAPEACRSTYEQGCMHGSGKPTRTPEKLLERGRRPPEPRDGMEACRIAEREIERETDGDRAGAHQKSRPRRARMPRSNACFTFRISVTVSASSTSCSGAFRPVATMFTCSGRPLIALTTSSTGSQPKFTGYVISSRTTSSCSPAAIVAAASSHAATARPRDW